MFPSADDSAIYFCLRIHGFTNCECSLASSCITVLTVGESSSLYLPKNHTTRAGLKDFIDFCSLSVKGVLTDGFPIKSSCGLRYELEACTLKPKKVTASCCNFHTSRPNSKGVFDPLIKMPDPLEFTVTVTSSVLRKSTSAFKTMVRSLV